MTATFAEALAVAEALTTDERRELIELIALGLDDDPAGAVQAPPELSDDLRAELRRRIAAHEAAPSRVLTWEQVEASVRRGR